MSSSEESGATSPISKFRGVRCRKWGKWVSEIRVPGTQERLWLGSYSTPEAAAVAHDIATYCLRPGASSIEKLNFPLFLPAGVREDMSPRSIQLVASDAGMAVDAQLKMSNGGHVALGESRNRGHVEDKWCRNGGDLSVSVDDYM